MERKDRWNLVVAAMQADIEGFEVKFKTDSAFQRLLGFLSVWSWNKDEEGRRVYGYLKMTTTIGSKVWFESEAYVNEHLPSETLEHEWVHLKDQRTFFGWLPFLPRWINSALFGVGYIGILPWPGLVRAYAELRAYRRSMELSPETKRDEAIEYYIKQFTGPAYLFMWPFPDQVRRLLKKPSPYREEMNTVTGRMT